MIKVGDKIRVTKTYGSNLTNNLAEGAEHEVIKVLNSNGGVAIIHHNLYDIALLPEQYEVVERTTKENVKLEYGQVWEIDSQEELDALETLMKKQNIDWYSQRWTYKTLQEDGYSNKVAILREYNDKIVAGNSCSNVTHSGKILLEPEGDKKIMKKQEHLLHTYPNQGSEGRTLEVWNIDGELIFKTGCFPQKGVKGTIQDFEKAVNRKHKYGKDGIPTDYWNKYNTIISALKLEHPDLVKPEEKLYHVILPGLLSLGNKVYLARERVNSKEISTDERSQEYVKSNPRYYAFTEKEIKDIDPVYWDMRKLIEED